MKKLTGTEKQIAWAEDIRNRYMQCLENVADAHEIFEKHRAANISGSLSDLTEEQKEISEKKRLTEGNVETAKILYQIFSDETVRETQKKFEKRTEEGKRYFDSSAYYRELERGARYLIENQESAKFWIDFYQNRQ